MKCACRGFSLTEMLVVIAILILLMAAVLPALGPMRRRNDLRVGATTVAGALRSARSLAISRSRLCYVYANQIPDPDPDEILLYQDSVDKPDREERLPEGISINSISSQPIVFRPDGSALNACTIVVENRSGYRRSVTVAAVSGRVNLGAEEND